MQKRKRNYKLDYRNYNPFVYSIFMLFPTYIAFRSKTSQEKVDNI